MNSLIRSVWLLTLASLTVAAQENRDLKFVTVERKQALIIANSAYPLAPLKNPTNDATAMDATLRKLGFEVHTHRDLSLRRMNEVIEEFASSLAPGSLAFFYYSGHGMQVDGSNYLIPVDFEARSKTDALYASYPASKIQDRLEESRARLRVLILDACRSNPFRVTRDPVGGLARMSADAEGTLIAFATGDRKTADDNPAESNGLYTKYLVSALLTPGVPLKDLFQKAKEDVYAASKGRQNPSTYENLIGTFYLIPPVKVVASAGDPARDAWEIAKDGSREVLEAFVREFPESGYAKLARIKLAGMNTPAAATPSTISPLRPSAPAPELHAPSPESSAPGAVIVAGPQAGSKRVNPKDGLTYVWIPPGKFMMGCSPGDTECDGDEKPAHEETIAKGFWLGQTEVTQSAWRRVMGNNPSSFKGDDRPVESITFDEAKKYCEVVGGRLPTEAEWEYAARAGSTAARYGELDSIAWYDKNSGRQTHPVKQKEPNAWGLYDMLGNVWEWVDGGQNLRGGSWNYYPRVVRASFRYWYVPGNRNYNVGVRCRGEFSL